MFAIGAAAIAVAAEAAAAVGAGFMAALPAALGGATGAIGAGTGIGAGTAAGAGAAAAAGAGGISAGAGGIAGSIGAGLSGIAQGAVLGSGLGAITSAATGGDVGKGAAMGAATGAIGGGITSGLGEISAGMSAADEVGTLADVADEGGSTATVAPGKGVVTNAVDLSQTALGPDIPVAFEPTPATMSPEELSSAIRQPVATNAPPMGVGSSGSNVEAINAVNAKPPVTAPTAPTSNLGYIDKGINYIKDNPGVGLQLGGTALSMMGGSNQQENAPEPVYPYTPSTYTPPPIEKTSVPQYYDPTGSYGYTGGYAEGGVINSAQPNGFMNNTPSNGFMNNTQPNGAMNGAQPNGAMNGAQPNGPMNPIVARATEQVKLQQSQQGQQSQMPPTPPPAPQGIMGAQTQPQFIVLPQQQQQPMGQPMGQPIGQFTQPPMGQPMGGTTTQPTQNAAGGGMMRDNLGGYSHGGIAGLTRGPGDGVSDSIPAQIGGSGKQPARLADGEFVIPSRIVSELGNGSTEAGAKALQAMVDRIQTRRSKTVGKGKVAVNSRARKELA